MALALLFFGAAFLAGFFVALGFLAIAFFGEADFLAFGLLGLAEIERISNIGSTMLRYLVNL